MKKHKHPSYEQKIKDLTLIKKRTNNDPEQGLMCHLLYSVRNYLRLKGCSEDIRTMSVSKIISFSKKRVDKPSNLV